MTRKDGIGVELGEREAVLEARDGESLGTLRRMWELRDPVPTDLAERVSFVLSLENLEAELMTLASELSAPVGARGEDQARNVTFSSEHLSVMVTISDDRSDVRLDGWIGDGAGILVAVRRKDGDVSVVTDPQTPERSTTADDDGRFSFTGLAHGLVQLVFQPGVEARLPLARPVVTPAVQI